MAFLTKYNFSKLCQSLEINLTIDLDLFVEHIYNDKEIFFILNKMEIEYLFKYKMLLDNEVKFLAKYYIEVPEKEDTKKLVFDKGGKTKYHLNHDCKFLKNDYLDFHIPNEIQELGSNAIHEYRLWFKANRYAEKHRNNEIDTNTLIRDFNNKYPKKYGIGPIEDNSNILVVEMPNSSSQFTAKEFDLSGFKERLNNLKDEWYNSFQCKVSRKFAKFKYLLNKTDDEIHQKMSDLFAPEFTDNYGLENLKRKFEISKRINNQIISELLEYFKWTYKIEEKKFDALTLEKFGLKCCSFCEAENRG